MRNAFVTVAFIKKVTGKPSPFYIESTVGLNPKLIHVRLGMVK